MCLSQNLLICVDVFLKTSEPTLKILNHLGTLDEDFVTKLFILIWYIFFISREYAQKWLNLKLSK